MKRVAFYVLAAIAAPFIIAIVGLAVGFAVALHWLVGDDE